MKIKPNAARFFAIVTLFFGFTTIVLTPPFQGPDEPAHYIQAYHTSRGELVTKAAKLPTTLPTSVDETIFELLHGKYDVRFNPNKKYMLDATRELINKPLHEDTQTKVSYLRGTSYPFIAYIPQGIMMFFGRIFDVSPLGLMYLGRIGNLVAWTVIVYFAVRVIPVGKRVLACIALLPMAVFQASVISADVVPSALLLLMVALIVRAFAQNSLTWKSLLTIFLVGIVMTLCKPIFALLFPLPALLLFSKAGKRNVKTNLIRVGGGLIVSVLIAAVLYKLLAQAGGGTDTTPANVDAAVQLKHLVTKPNEFWYAFWNVNAFTWGDGITKSFVGTFGWADAQPPLTFVIACYVMLVVALGANRQEEFNELRGIARTLPRLFLLLLAAVFYIATSIVLYAFYTPVDFNIIVGLQGRYFLPILAIAYFVFINKDAITLNKKTYQFFVSILPVLLLAVAAANIYIRYYYNTLI